MAFFKVDGISGGNGKENVQELSRTLGHLSKRFAPVPQTSSYIKDGEVAQHKADGVHLDMEEVSNIGDREDAEFERY